MGHLTYLTSTVIVFAVVWVMLDRAGQVFNPVFSILKCAKPVIAFSAVRIELDGAVDVLF
jgi:hypothetical protein